MGKRTKYPKLSGQVFVFFFNILKMIFGDIKLLLKISYEPKKRRYFGLPGRMKGKLRNNFLNLIPVLKYLPENGLILSNIAQIRQVD